LSGFFIFKNLNSVQKYFDYLFSLERTGIKYDLSNITRLLEHLNNPHHKFKSIHIAGTNGKGAVASFINSIMMEHRLKTGLYTSPHILKFHERIRINNKPIDDKTIIKFVDMNLKVIKKINPSFFEVTTALAFKYFADNQIDVGIIEAGLGGRLDSTNVLLPHVSCITQIGLDHTEYLGNSLQEITKEKLGIIKKGVPVVISDNHIQLKRIFDLSVPVDFKYSLSEILKIKKIIRRKESLDCSITINFKNQILKFNFTLPFTAEYQIQNAAAAIVASVLFFEKNNLPYSIKKIEDGIKQMKINSSYRCRQEKIKVSGRQFVLDVSHNFDGIKSTFKSLIDSRFDAIIFGMMDDKDYKKSLELLRSKTEQIILTKPDYKRAVSPTKLLESLKNKFYKNVVVTGKVGDAIDMVFQDSSVKNILIIGSFFLVSDAIKALKFEKKFS